MPDLTIRINLAREMGWLEEFGWGGRVIVSAHVLEGLKKRAAHMVGRLGCPYVIDPYTYVFGADTQEIEDRRWFPRLAAEYGIDTIADSDSMRLRPGMLVRDGVSTDSLRELVQNVIEHQKGAIAGAAGEANPYSSFESDPGGGRAPAGPDWVIPPYFFVDGANSDWIEVNIRSAEAAAEAMPEAGNLCAMVMVDHDLLADHGFADSLASAYRGLPVAGYLVWPAYLNENRAEKAELANFRRFAGELSRDGRPVRTAYGGLFSLLAGPAISGVSHAICYGEHRNPFETASGGFAVRLYLPGICSKVPYGRIEEIKSALGLAECGCTYCGPRAGGARMPQIKHAALHFLEQRRRELEQIGEGGEGEFLKRAASAHSGALRNDSAGAYSKFYAHLKTWKDALSGPAPGDAAQSPGR